MVHKDLQDLIALFLKSLFLSFSLIFTTYYTYFAFS